MSLVLPSNPQAIGPVSTINIIKAIEALGGSRGYLEHIKSAQSGGRLAQPLSLLSVSNSLSSDVECPRKQHNCSIRLQAGRIPGLLCGEIIVYDPNDDDGVGIHLKHVAEIRGWVTEGQGYTDLYGAMLVFTSWEDMREGPIKFSITAREGKGVHVTFTRGCLQLAVISADFPEACGIQEGSYSGEGDCTWNDIVF